MHFILFVLIGLIAGALAGRVVSGHGYGMLGDLIVGVVGAFLGGCSSPWSSGSSAEASSLASSPLSSGRSFCSG